MSYYNWDQLLYQLQQTNQYLLQQVQQLEDRIAQLEEDIQNHQQQPTVDKIEYKFDQLKVEHLEGTLHVGLSPSDLQQIEDVGIGEGEGQNISHINPLKNVPTYPEGNRNTSLISKLNQYLHEECPKLIQDLSKEYNHPIDKDYENLLIQDMEKQLPNRVAFYENDAQTNQIEKKNVHPYILEKVKEEITHSLRTYMENNKGNEEGK